MQRKLSNLYIYENFVKKLKKDSIDYLEKKLKKESTNLVYFDGEQHKIDVEKIMKLLKKL